MNREQFLATRTFKGELGAALSNGDTDLEHRPAYLYDTDAFFIELSADGGFQVTVASDSACFDTLSAAENYLWPRANLACGYESAEDHWPIDPWVDDLEGLRAWYTSAVGYDPVAEPPTDAVIMEGPDLRALAAGYLQEIDNAEKETA